MAKTAFEAPRSNMYMLLPEEITIVEDKEHWLYDSRILTPPDEEFIADIERRGIMQPVRVVKEDDKTLLVMGRRRVTAAAIINKRRKINKEELLRVPCWLVRGDEAELYEMSVAENTHRRDDSIAETVKKATRLMNLTGDPKRAAAALRKTPAQVQQLLKINELHKSVRKALYSNQIGMAAALQFHGLSHPDQEAALLKLLEAAGEQPAVAPSPETALPSPSSEDEPPPASSPKTEKPAKTRKRPAVSGKQVKETLGKQSGVRGLKEIEERIAIKTLPPDYRAALLWVIYRDTSVASEIK